jgi:hypothetical protein
MSECTIMLAVPMAYQDAIHQAVLHGTRKRRKPERQPATGGVLLGMSQDEPGWYPRRSSILPGDELIDVGIFGHRRHGDHVIDLDAQMPDSAFQFRVTE